MRLCWPAFEGRGSLEWDSLCYTAAALMDKLLKRKVAQEIAL